MTDEVITTQDEEVKIDKVEETTETEETKEQSQVEAEKTAGEVVESTVEAKKDTVALATFLEVKKQNKEQAKAIKELEAKIQERAEDGESISTSDFDAIAEEYPDIDQNFLKKFSSSIENKIKKELEEKYDSKLKPFEERERTERNNNAFTKEFNKVMENMTEFQSVVNPEVIKTLSLDKKNANKTFKQIIEETYSSALTGKRTIESTKHGGGKEAGPLDFRKAQSDEKYFDEIMNDPKLKEQYTKKMLEQY